MRCCDRKRRWENLLSRRALPQTHTLGSTLILRHEPREQANNESNFDGRAQNAYTPLQLKADEKNVNVCEIFARAAKIEGEAKNADACERHENCERGLRTQGRRKIRLVLDELVPAVMEEFWIAWKINEWPCIQFFLILFLVGVHLWL